MPVGRHEHCDKCYDVHCRAPDQVSVSCGVMGCGKNCGATLHKCKLEEHQLLCPNETVPCLNAHYGCPLAMLRHRLAEHLEVCPASVVCCSQEWSRWPLSDTDLTFCRDLSEDLQPELHLDVAAALRDQELLFQSIKMKNVFPELMMEDLQVCISGVKCPAEEAACSSDHGKSAESSCTRTEGEQLGQEEKALAKSTDIENIYSDSSWEKIFTKEMGGCVETVKNLNKTEEKEKQQGESSNCQREARNSHLNQQKDAAVASSSDGATGLAPWQDGVLERLGKQVDAAEYNTYLRHNGAMLITFGQLAACTPREKDFVYGNLEPIEVQTVRTFKVPTSYRAKRGHMKDPAHKARSAHKSVDTSDLGVPIEDLPKCDEISATLLCSLERELRGHSISESKGVDGLYVDVGTQTYNFRLAPFKADASLADVAAHKPQGLYVHVEAESVTRRHNKTNSAFTYMCGRFFRRDEYPSHFRNVHSDIQASLGGGWLQHRCPLAYLGCTFSQTRLQPAGHQAEIKFRRDVSGFVLQPLVPSSLCTGGETSSPQRTGARNLDPLSRLPLEILQHIAGYLDSFTLSQLSQVSQLMRELCAMLLQGRGMVSLKWEKKTYSHGGSAWRCRKKVWEFSSVFSSVDRWSFSSAPSMSDHLKTCSFYQREERTEPVVLAGLREVADKGGEAKHQR